MFTPKLTDSKADRLKSYPTEGSGTESPRQRRWTVLAPNPYGSADRPFWCRIPTAAQMDRSGTESPRQRRWTILAPNPHGSADGHDKTYKPYGTFYRIPTAAQMDRSGTESPCQHSGAESPRQRRWTVLAPNPHGSADGPFW